MEELITVLHTQLVEGTGSYDITVGAGMSLNEVAFSIAAAIKIFIREGFIKDSKEVIDMIQTYCNDPKYQEIKDDEQ